MSGATVNPRLAAKRARVRRIRRSAVALTVALFIATWSVIFATLASGHDPALSASSSGSAKAGAKKSVAASSSGSYPSSSSTGSSESDSSSASAPSVSTHQS
jgi:cytoskeletal protein RodZ